MSADLSLPLTSELLIAPAAATTKVNTTTNAH